MDEREGWDMPSRPDGAPHMSLNSDATAPLPALTIAAPLVERETDEATLPLKVPAKQEADATAARAARAPHQRRRVRTIVALGVACVLLLLAIPPSLLAYSTYHEAKALALDGVRHLEAVKAKLPTSTDNLGTLLDAKTIAGMRLDVQAAQQDFTQLQSLLDHSSIVGMASGLPSIEEKIQAARHLARIGGDLAQAAQTLLDTATIVITIFHRSPLNASVPFLTTADLAQLTAALNTLAPLLTDIGTQAQGANLGSLLSASQQKLLQKVITGLPQIAQTIATAHQFIAVAPAILGLKSPETYLVVAMDRSELRAGGGFQGNYAIATVGDGRLTNTLKLTDTYLLDEKNGICWDPGSTVPASYQSWWIWGCWGLRDTNISADFPTTARYALQEYTAESGQHVQGFVAITPRIIQQLLDITGPIKIGYGYNVTVTSANLEATIHYFQLGYHGAGGVDLPPPDQISSKAKRFTALLGRALQDRLHHLPQNDLVKLAKDAFDDIKTKDIQIYATDPTVEHFFSAQHIDAAMQRSGDGIFVVDTNLSGKQNTYVQEQIADSVQLDSAGAATHTLTLTYDFANPSHAPSYGYYAGGAYRDYLRIYIPAQSVFLSSDDSNISQVPSDEPERAMWGGWVIVGQNAGPVTMTLRWRVPAVAAKGQPYHMFIQKQAGNHVSIVLTIGIVGAKQPLLNYATPVKTYQDQDKLFTVAHPLG
jgi:hypothetical protein